MIFTDRTIIVQKGTSSINDTIILYRGDKEVEIRFALNEGSPFRFGSGASPNIIEKTEAAYGQLIIKTPNDLPSIFSEVVPTNEGKIIFTITAEMIDEITEVGNYTFQIRLFDESMNSRATLPEVVNGIEIREPIAAEDVSNEVGVATVGYTITTVGTPEDTFDSQGNYNKTTWGTGDRITAAKLNKIEAGIDGVNKKVASGGAGGEVDLSGYVTKEVGNANQITFADGQTFQAKLDAGTLKGDKGDTGAQGIQGEKGEKGERGVDGLTTSISVNGTTYTQVDGVITLPDYSTNTGSGSADLSNLALSVDSQQLSLKNSDATLSTVTIPTATDEQITAVIQSKINDGSISSTTIGANSVLTENIADGQVTPNKTSFLYDRPINLNNANECVAGMLDLSNGGIVDNSSYTTSGFINVEYNTKYKTTVNIYTYCAYDAEKTFIKGYTLNNVNEFTIEDNSNIKYIRCTIWGSSDITNWNLCRENEFVDTYIPFDSAENKIVKINDKLKTEIISNVKENISTRDILQDNSLSIEMTNYLYRHHDNLNNPDTCETGYIGSDGNVVFFDGVTVSGFIPVEEGMIYMGGGNWDSGYYDENKNFIEKFNSTDSKWTVPTGKGIKYARVSGIGANTMIIKGTVYPSIEIPYTENDIRFKNNESKELFAKYIGANSSNIKGLNWYAIGDSITQGTGTTDGYMYMKYVVENKGCNYVNYGIAGTRLATSSDDSSLNNNAMSVRIDNYDENADIITIFGGTNDPESTLGTFDDRTTNTVYGALHHICEVLVTKYAGKKVGFITPIKYGPSQNSKIVDAIIEVAKYYNIPVLNLYENLGMLFCINDEIKAKYCADGIHPGNEGHKIIARKVAEWLETL